MAGWIKDLSPAEIDRRINAYERWLDEAEAKGEPFRIQDLAAAAGASKNWLYISKSPGVRAVLRRAQNLQDRLGRVTKITGKTERDRRATYRRPHADSPEWVWDLWAEACRIGWSELATQLRYSQAHLHNTVAGIKPISRQVQEAWLHYQKTKGETRHVS